MLETNFPFPNNLPPHLYTKTDKEWLENKQGIINRKGEFVTLEIIGQKIAKFKEDVEKLKRGEYKPVSTRDEVEQLIKSLTSTRKLQT